MSLEKDIAEQMRRLVAYQAELDAAGKILQVALPIGQVKHIGLLEVAAGVSVLADNLKRSEAALAAAAEQLRESNEEMAKLITENERLVRCYRKYSVSVRNACTVLGGELFLGQDAKDRMYYAARQTHDYLRKLVDDVDKMMGGDNVQGK